MQFLNGQSRMIWGTKRIRRATRLLGLLAVLAAAFAFAAPLEAQEGTEPHYVDLIMLYEYGLGSDQDQVIYKVRNVGTATATGVTVSFLLEDLEGGIASPDQRTVDGTNTAFTWEVGTILPGQTSAAVQFVTTLHSGLHYLFPDWPGRVGVINATASALDPEPSTLLGNNRIRVYTFAYGSGRTLHMPHTQNRLALLLSVDDLGPDAEGDVNFGLNAQNYNTGRPVGHPVGNQIAEINIQVELSDGLAFKAGWVPPGELAIAFSGRSATWQPAVVDTTSTTDYPILGKSPFRPN